MNKIRIEIAPTLVFYFIFLFSYSLFSIEKIFFFKFHLKNMLIKNGMQLQKQPLFPGWSQHREAVTESSPSRIQYCMFRTTRQQFFPLFHPKSPPPIIFFACGRERLISWIADSAGRHFNSSYLSAPAWSIPYLFPSPSESILEESQALGAPVKQVSTFAKHFLQGAQRARVSLLLRHERNMANLDGGLVYPLWKL